MVAVTRSGTSRKPPITPSCKKGRNRAPKPKVPKVPVENCGVTAPSIKFRLLQGPPPEDKVRIVIRDRPPTGAKRWPQDFRKQTAQTSTPPTPLAVPIGAIHPILSPARDFLDVSGDTKEGLTVLEVSYCPVFKLLVPPSSVVVHNLYPGTVCDDDCTRPNPTPRLTCGIDSSTFILPDDLDRPAEPRWTIEFGEYRGKGDLWYGYSATLVSPDFGRQAVFAKVSSTFEDESKAHPRDRYFHEDVVREACAYSKLESCQGRQVPYFYGLWKGECGLLGRGKGRTVYVLLLEDVGTSIGKLLGGDDWTSGAKWTPQITSLLTDVYQKGVISPAGMLNLFHVFTRQASPSSDFDGPLCVADFCGALFVDDGEKYESAAEVQTLWIKSPREPVPVCKSGES